jgi:hypothetical protein
MWWGRGVRICFCVRNNSLINFLITDTNSIFKICRCASVCSTNIVFLFQDIQCEESGGDGLQHPSLSALRPIPSPVGSSGSRSNTPASLPG